jgi:ATP-dependent Zn protease
MFSVIIYSHKLDLANLVNIAAIKAAVEGAEKLTASQLEFAKDRIIMGTERKTMFVSEESKKVCIGICVKKFSLVLKNCGLFYWCTF